MLVKPKHQCAHTREVPVRWQDTRQAISDSALAFFELRTSARAAVVSARAAVSSSSLPANSA